MLDSANRERALLVLGGAAAASLIPALVRRLQRRGAGPAVGPAAAAAAAVDPTRSTTSSAGGGVGAYETRKAVDEYLQFHYGKPEEVLPYEAGPQVRSGPSCSARRQGAVVRMLWQRNRRRQALWCRRVRAPGSAPQPHAPHNYLSVRPLNRRRCGSQRRLRCCASGTAAPCKTSQVGHPQAGALRAAALGRPGLGPAVSGCWAARPSAVGQPAWAAAGSGWRARTQHALVHLRRQPGVDTSAKEQLRTQPLPPSRPAQASARRRRRWALAAQRESLSGANATVACIFPLQASARRRRRWTLAAPWGALPLSWPAPSPTSWASTSPNTL